VNVGHVIEVALEFRELGTDVVAQGFRDLDVMSADTQLHDCAPSVGNTLN
jgi:hypothetical protein